MLTWDGVRALRDAGWDIGSHTLNHPRLARLSPDEAKKELEESRRVLERELGTPPVSFAHPYGNGADDLPLRLLIQAAGYKTACSVHQGLADPARAPLALRRIFVRGDDTRWDFHLNMTRGRARL
jgi:peptidoglycan/xylan/chitin deacetylase (PgdA/CDA1 family)